jgi:ribonucleoside-diphosphate reductase alpha chain
MPEGQVEVKIEDYAYTKYGVKGRTADEVSPKQHVKVLCAAQKFVDSAVSKTVNITGEISGQMEKGHTSFEDFKDLYFQAYRGGAKGCTTFNKNGKKFGIFVEDNKDDNTACYIDPETGSRTCEA